VSPVPPENPKAAEVCGPFLSPCFALKHDFVAVASTFFPLAHCPDFLRSYILSCQEDSAEVAQSTQPKAQLHVDGCDAVNPAHCLEEEQRNSCRIPVGPISVSASGRWVQSLLITQIRDSRHPEDVSGSPLPSRPLSSSYVAFSFLDSRTWFCTISKQGKFWFHLKHHMASRHP